MSYVEIVKEWNEIADGYNQWSVLGEDEKIEFAFRLGFRHGIGKALGEIPDADPWVHLLEH